MAGIFDQVEKSMDAFADKKIKFDPYYFFEPWDCELPEPSVYKAAIEDGVDLEDDNSAKLAGTYPRQFQTGSILSTKKMVITQAGSRSGKSICTQVEVGAMVSRKPPYAFRYDKGVDTGIARPITEPNIIRWGRRDKETGEVVDYDPKKQQDGTWDCGNIVGAGKYPIKKYAPKGSQIWIGTIAKSVDTMWWPSFAGQGEHRFFPQEFIDTSKGNKGYNKQAGIIHCINDIDIHIKTYEQGHTKFESQTAWLLAYDEEPDKKEIYLSGALHAKYQRFSFTPLKGKTWSEEVFFSCLPGYNNKKDGLRRSDFDYFWASQFDSPYVPREKLWRDRRAMELWERRARVWGQYSEFEGMPFFNRSKIQQWRKDYTVPYKIGKFVPAVRYFHVHGSKVEKLPGILDIKVTCEKVEEENEKDTWRVYEDVEPGVGYMAVFDPAEGALELEEVQDRSFGLIIRLPTAAEIYYEGLPRVVATCRSTLPTVAFARSSLPVLRFYNNAVLAAERGHGKDNEAFGLTLEDWPYWYYYQPRSAATKRPRPKKGFDTNSHTRTACLDKLREWTDRFEVDEDPGIRDAWIYGELAGAIIKETVSGKKRCDHPRTGSLDGVICLGIGTYIVQESPNDIVCNYYGPDHKKQGLFERVRSEQFERPAHIPMGAGVSKVGGR